METLYKKHLEKITEEVRTLLSEEKSDVLILSAGGIHFYHADDQEVLFRTHAHFARFTPVTGPNHILIIDQNEPLPLLVEFRPDDFWEEQTDNSPTFWREYVSCLVVKNHDELKKIVIEKVHGKKLIFIGDTEGAERLKEWSLLMHPSQNLLGKLDSSRAKKTPYEIACIDEANKIAATGHKKLQEMFLEGASEREMYYGFLVATATLAHELPYEPIIALDEKAATLHYHHKRNSQMNGAVLLVDAGVSVHGYASDVTRTIHTSKAHPVFINILNDLDLLQQKLCAQVKPGAEFIELHHAAHIGIANILIEHNVLLCSKDEAIDHGFTQAFFPHGLGHMLGLQVHDVGNASSISEQHPLKKRYPHIRTNRKFEVGHVTTIEPGIYFIAILLNPFRNGEYATSFNWRLIDELLLSGGIRIEDNLVVTEHGAENLTRKYL